MADNVIDGFGGGEPDPLVDQGEPQVEPINGEQPVVEEDSFGDLPFTSKKAAADAYKNIQRAYTERSQAFWDLQKQLNELSPRVKDTQVPPGRSPEEAEEDVNATLESFLKGPTKTFTGVFEKKMPQLLDTRLTPLEKRMAKFELKQDVDNFLRDNPDITVDDETELINIIRSTPRIQALPNMSDRMEAALDRLMRVEPTRFSARKIPAKPDQALLNAKKGAGALSGKGGSKASEGDEDPFDKVLASDAGRTARWKR